MLEISDLTKRYGDVVALDGATFRAAPGRIVGFLGPNGAGKTTTMRAIFGLVHPDRGEVRWRGAPVGPEQRARFGYMPEERGLYPKMRVGEQLVFFAELSGLQGCVGRRGRRPLARPPRPRGPRGVPSGGAVARQPAARAVRGGARPRPRARRAGRAVQRPRSARRRGARRVAPRDGGERGDRRLLEPPARPGRGRLSGRRHHRSRPDRAGRRRRGSQGRGLPSLAADRRERGAVDARAPSGTVTSKHDGQVRVLVDASTDLAQILASAREAGEVTRFSFEPPSLTDLFLEAVSEERGA